MVHTPRLQPAPPKLRAKQKAWTQRWKDGPRDWATKAAREALKQALGPMTHGKCAFCEGLLDAQSHFEIEHYIAKTIEPDLVFEWTNLFPSCGKCNRAKGDTDHRGAQLKPDRDDPERFLWVHPEGRLEPHPSLGPAERDRVAQTIAICALNRGALCVLRKDAWTRTLGYVTPDLRGSGRDALLDPVAQFKLVVRQVLKLHDREALAEEDRRVFERR